jgi:hypothetical protein
MIGGEGRKVRKFCSGDSSGLSVVCLWSVSDEIIFLCLHRCTRHIG